MSKAIVVGKLKDVETKELIGYILNNGIYTVYVTEEKLSTLDNVKDKDILQYLGLEEKEVYRVRYNGVENIIDPNMEIDYDEDMKDIFLSTTFNGKKIMKFGHVFSTDDLIPLDSDYAIERMMSNIEF